MAVRSRWYGFFQKETDALHAHLAGGLTDEQVKELVAFSRKVADGLDKADIDFALRKRIIEYLNTRVIFAIEEGEQVAYLQLQFGYYTRLTKDSNVNQGESLSLQLESAPLASSPSGVGDSYTQIGMHSMGCMRS